MQTELLVDYAMTILGAVTGLALWRASGWRVVLTLLLAGPVAAVAAIACKLLLAAYGHQGHAPGMVGQSLFVPAGCALSGLLAAMRDWTRRAGPRVLRGARVTHAPPRRGRRPRDPGGAVHLAGYPVPHADEPKHFKIIGTTGTGKTTAITELLDGALARGDRAVIADPDGVFLNRFFDEARGDQVLGPLCPDADGWDLFAEVRHVQDADGIARALVPDLGGEDRTWRSYARVLVSSTIRQCIAAGCHDLGELHRLLTMADVEELRALLDGTPAASYLTPDNARFFASVRAITSSELAVLEFVASQRAERAVSVREWVAQGARHGQPGVLFLPYRASHLATLRGLIACWLRIALFEAMEQTRNETPLWFVVDELDSLGTIDGLKDALARIRKYGGRCVLGLQSIAQLTGNYGAPAAQTIVENCGNTLLLRCSAADNGGTARFASTLIGDREVIRTQVSRTRAGIFGKADPSRSETTQQHTERAVLASEIEQLPDLQGYLKFASAPDWHRVAIER